MSQINQNQSQNQNNNEININNINENPNQRKRGCKYFCLNLCACCTISINSIPILSTCLGTFLLFLNIIFPGLGTMCLFFCAEENNLTHLCVGLLQFFTCFLIIGWILSVIWGLEIFRKSLKYIKQKENKVKINKSQVNV